MRILLVEDEIDIATALTRGMRQQGYAVDAVEDGQQALEQVAITDYDLLILDLNLPTMDGLEVCRRLRRSHSTLPILMLTARSQPQERVIGLDTGADDYLVKPFHFAELLARVRALLRRDVRMRPPLLAYKDIKLDPATHTAWQGHRRLELTNKEFGILEYLLCHRGETVSQETLLEHVWDMQANPLTNTVRVHINSLRRKLEDVAETPHYIETLIGHGYRLCTLDTPETPGISPSVEEPT
ncbi:MAG TPA: response regulator transcription factor [Ktedonobacteraceae bacterium]|nr:response regulator transcription factor [Ktedonobacteraceae bacterium]